MMPQENKEARLEIGKCWQDQCQNQQKDDIDHSLILVKRTEMADSFQGANDLLFNLINSFHLRRRTMQQSFKH